MSRLHPLVNPNPKESMMVVWTDGKPTTVIKTKEGGNEDIPLLPFQYTIPLSKYNTLANVAHRRSQKPGHRGTDGQRRMPQVVTIQQLPDDDDSGRGDAGKEIAENGNLDADIDTVSSTATGTRNSAQSSPESSPVHNHTCTEDKLIAFTQLEKEYNALKSKEQEEQVELRRLRTENRLLRQRIDNLEKETGTLADRLIQDQVRYAQQEEEIYVLRRDLSVARQHGHDATLRLDEVTNQLEEYKDRSDSQSSTASAEDLEDTIHTLERQLADVRRQAADGQCVIQELKVKIKAVENQNQQLSMEPSIEIQHLQEELIACKLREAEANLSLKELQQKVHELDKHCQKYLERQTMSNVKVTKEKSQQLTDELMSVRLKEAEAVAELQDNKLKLMELETQNHIQHRQIKRQEEDIERHQSTIEQNQAREKEFIHQVKELERTITNVQTKEKEDQMMSKIRDAEHTQAIAEMRRRIAELEIENQELVTEGQLQQRGDRQDLENKVTELQEEVLQLKMAHRLHSMSSLALNNINLESESEYDTDDLDSTRLHLNSEGTVDTSHTRPIRPTLPELDSSDAESLAESADGTTRNKILRKKKRASGKRDLDLDRTPTQDSVNGVFFPGENGQMSASFSEFGRHRDVSLTNGATGPEKTNSDTLSQSVTLVLPTDPL